MRRLVYYVGMTIDGFIAGPDDQVDFFPQTDDIVNFIVDQYPDTLPTHVREQLDIHVANPNFDIALLGLATYQPALSIGVTSPYAHLRQYVVSASMAESPDPAIEIISADLIHQVQALKAEPDGGDIYLAGGGRLAGSLLEEIDALVIKLYPVAVGTGVPLFTTAFAPTRFSLTSTRALAGGTVILEYQRDERSAGTGEGRLNEPTAQFATPG